MYKQTFLFTSRGNSQNAVYVSAETLYDETNRYGFVTEINRNAQENLGIAELNSGFEPWFWFSGQDLTHLCTKPDGVSLTENDAIPLIFKADVPRQGNYQVTVTIFAGETDIENLLLFTGRRRLMNRNITIKANCSVTLTYTVNICDIIPRGKGEAYADTSFDLTLLVQPSENSSSVSQPILSEITVEEVSVPTIYIAGDSTLTDQSGVYPYNAGCCYCGWAQMLPLFFKPGIAISNHAHSGLTTESFRSEGHYRIVQDCIREGDYFIIQFGHNDQKRPHLAAYTGYSDNLRAYIKEAREKNAVPIIVTPLARNTWKADSSYNDLLADWSDACIQIGKELSVPVIDLHGVSMEFVKREGLESAKRYFYPKDYTHSNDYGAYRMADFVADMLKTSQIPGLSEFVRPGDGEWIPPQSITFPTPPAGYEIEAPSAVPSEDSLERPDDMITRAEALDYIIKAVRFVPMNVYNDMYPDVIGHEWYAGVVEAAYQNSIVDAALTADGKFHPSEKVTGEQLISFCMNGYLSRKPTPANIFTNDTYNSVSGWAKKYVALAAGISLLPLGFDLKTPVTRKCAVGIIRKLESLV